MSDKPGGMPEKLVECPVHKVNSTFSPIEETLDDDMTFRFLQVDDCGCLYAFAVDTPKIAALKADVTNLWVRLRTLSVAGDTGGVHRTQKKINAAENRVKDVQRNIWAEHGHRIKDVVGVADGLARTPTGE